MNLKRSQPKNKTKDLLLSITTKCEVLIEQTHRKAKKTMEFKLAKQRETFHFKARIQLKDFGC